MASGALAAAEARSFTVWGDIPEGCRNVPLVAGIDEAGRGSVIGDMIYGIAFWPADADAEISRLGFQDSKTLTPEARDKLFEGLKATGRIGWVIRRVSAEEISAKMLLRSAVSLNAMAFDAALGLAKGLVSEGLMLSKLIVDTVGDPERYRRFLHDGLDGRVDVVVEKKADATYPVVSAASIAAKCSRDASVKADALKARCLEQAVDIRSGAGSGYPSDPVCKAWMREVMHPVFGWPSVARFSWANAKDMLDTDAIAVDFGEDTEEAPGDYAGGSATAAPARISTFFTPSAAGGSGASVRKPCSSLAGLGSAAATSVF
ncbi:hypothetical protein FNF27_01778 [Cafeteria roenbergensis]|uniref:Ribonuclease n=1 Tax=Cafeteria roenbergensis TaxID=33653 RepID=A0A5A8EGG8_CAFRO|nr:hypothetical protein FNF27_01778 [Cafeteria roenbergensis]